MRTARGPRQRIVAKIGKLPGLNWEERMGLGTASKSDPPRRAGGLISGAASKAVGPFYLTPD
jgi:hypothetical protein